MSYPQDSFNQTVLTKGSLIHRRRDAVSSNTIIYQLEVLRKTGRFDAFNLQWHPSYSDRSDTWPVPNHLFWDSDVAKWIEGACYFLHTQSHPQIESAIHHLVGMIASAQQPDGYINIHYTVVAPGQRFTNLRDMHELYNAGHLIEAALAHNALYHNDDLLRPIIKYVALLSRLFGPNIDQTHGYPGHPEIELALLRLHHRTQDPTHLELARYFLTERGNPRGVNESTHYYEAEAAARGDDPDKRPVYWPGSRALWYYQAHAPIMEQTSIEGHSVRAVYLFTAATDLVRYDLMHSKSSSASVADSERSLAAQRRLWSNMVQRKMYMTGGIGAIKQYEGFGQDYFLPQGTNEGGCYAETCAGIGVMMWAERLLQISLDAHVTDVMELALYNVVLTAMSHDGTKFTYVNQLASSDSDPSTREAWFTCACCPPNVMRLLGGIGGYIWKHKVAEGGAQIDVHLFIPSTLAFDAGTEGKVELEQKSDYPWSGDITFALKTSSKRVALNVRIPAWAEDWSISPPLPTICPKAVTNGGYLTLPPDWIAANPTFTLSLPLAPRKIAAHPFTNQDVVALARGPVVYCVEDVDNQWVVKGDHFKSLYLDAKCAVTEHEIEDQTTGDRYVGLSVKQGAAVVSVEDAEMAGPGVAMGLLGQKVQGAQVLDEVKFIPYYFRSNRGVRGEMRVGLRQWAR